MSSSVGKSTELDDTTPHPRSMEGGHQHPSSYDAAAAATLDASPRDPAAAEDGSRLNEASEANTPDNHHHHHHGEDEEEDDEDDDDDDGDDKDESGASPHPSNIPPNSMQMPPQQYGYGASPHHYGGYYMGYGPPPPGPPPPGPGGMIPPPHPDYGMAGPFGYADASQLNDPAPDTRRNRGGVTEPFPEKLHRMLDAAEREGLSDVVSFFPHGRAFAIHKPRRFVSEIMPRFFRQSRLTSFQRQLNLYGFRRISQGPDNGGYYHELFLKGRPGLCVNMKRTKVKGAQKLKRDPETEPNFYSYPPIGKPSAHGTPGAQPLTPMPQGQQPTPPRPPQANGAATPVSPAAPPFYPPPYPMPYYGQYPPPPPYTAAQQNAPVYPYPPYYGYPWGYPPPPPNAHMTPPHQQQQQQQNSPQQQQQFHQHHQQHGGHGTPDTTPVKSEGDHTPIAPHGKDDDDDDDDEVKPSVHIV